MYAFDARTTGQADGAAVTAPSGMRPVASSRPPPWGGACQAKSLWVDAAHRRQGLLSRVSGVRRAESPGYPRGHAQYVYVKPLAASDGA